MIPLRYNIGNLKARRVSTAMSIFGIGVVIAVMVSMMALDNGVVKATVSSGSKENLMILREGSESELASWVSKDAFHIIRALPGVVTASPEFVNLFKLPKRDNPKGSNISVRGVTSAAFQLRPYVKLVEGRMFRPGVNELIVARRVSNRFINCRIGDSFQFGPQKYTVVGIFEAAGTAFDSEMWIDLDYLMSARKRQQYSSVVVKAADAAAFHSINDAIKNDNRLKLQVKSEYDYYADQTRGLLGIKILVGIVTIFMMFGAILGTMNTMYSAIASRTRELATLRALGFKRRTLIVSVLVESAFVALLGGIVGILLSLPINGISTGTTNWNTFSEVAFSFQVDPPLAVRALMIALIAGVVGGLLPAVAAARMPITKALREI